ncbi:MAG: HAMP domain-containing protein [Chitinivibrionia bacterium]|nr:HAMP domain-containing protein [Chitinivibrionia bacterium]
MGFGIPLTVLLSVFGGWWLAGRALSPIGQMANQATRISAENLSERLPVAEPRDELSRLAMVFNDAFSRLERSFDQLRHFAVDASHELRTRLSAFWPSRRCCGRRCATCWTTQ